MHPFDIVAHRGAPAAKAPENTLPSFLRAIELGADAVELDVRLTADRVPVVFHYFYLDEITSLKGPIFLYTYEQIQEANYGGDKGPGIPTLLDVLDTIGGKIGLEIEIKGPESDSPQIVAEVLNQFKPLWDSIEITSYDLAVHRARLANARGVHLHPSQLSPQAVSIIRNAGIEVHVWDVNDEHALNTIVELGIPKICTDKLQQALDFRRTVDKF